MSSPRDGILQPWSGVRLERRASRSGRSASAPGSSAAELLQPDAPHWAELERLHAEGLVRAYGASVDWGADVDAAVAAGAQVLEVLLNAFHQEPLPALHRAQAAGVGVIVKVPLDS